MTVKAVAIEPLRFVNKQHGQVRLRIEPPNLGRRLRLTKRLEAGERIADAAVQRRDERDGVPGRGLRPGQRRRGICQPARLGIWEHLAAGVEDFHRGCYTASSQFVGMLSVRRYG